MTRTSEPVDHGAAGGSYDEMRKRVMESDQGGLQARVINRIDEIIIFTALSMEDLKRIWTCSLQCSRSEREEDSLTWNSLTAERIAGQGGYDPAYGARPLKRLIQKKIQNQLALLMLKGDLHEGERIKVTVNRKGDVALRGRQAAATAAS